MSLYQYRDTNINSKYDKSVIFNLPESMVLRSVESRRKIGREI